MDLLSILLRGLLIGFSIAAPVGPIGALCIRRTLADGHLVGLSSGLGAATADVIYGCVAAVGLTSVSGFLLDQQLWLRLIGGTFLLYLGLKTFLERPADREAAPENSSYTRLAVAYASTFFLTITNPSTVLSFAMIFVGLSIAETSQEHASAAILVVGVFSGSMIWWFFLSGGVSLFRRKFGSEALRRVNRVSGTIIFGFGVTALLSVLRGL